MISTFFMFVIPFGLFFIVQNNQYMLDTYGYQKTNTAAALAAVGGVQFVIFAIIVIKYFEDFLIVAKGEGHIPYDEALKEQAEYY